MKCFFLSPPLWEDGGAGGTLVLLIYITIVPNSLNWVLGTINIGMDKLVQMCVKIELTFAPLGFGNLDRFL